MKWFLRSIASLREEKIVFQDPLFSRLNTTFESKKCEIGKAGNKLPDSQQTK
jgi:hypothetical protein